MNGDTAFVERLIERMLTDRVIAMLIRQNLELQNGSC